MCLPAAQDATCCAQDEQGRESFKRKMWKEVAATKKGNFLCLAAISIDTKKKIKNTFNRI